MITILFYIFLIIIGLVVLIRLKDEERTANKLAMEAINLKYQLSSIRKKEVKSDINYQAAIEAYRENTYQVYDKNIDLMIIKEKDDQRKQSKNRQLAIVFTENNYTPLNDSKIA